MPKWVSLLFIIQILIVYFYASIAKIYPDWLDGTFTRNLLQGTTTRPFFLELFSQKWFYMFIAYTGIVFDLLIGVLGAFIWHLQSITWLLVHCSLVIAAVSYIVKSKRFTINIAEFPEALPEK